MFTSFGSSFDGFLFKLLAAPFIILARLITGLHYHVNKNGKNEAMGKFNIAVKFMFFLKFKYIFSSYKIGEF